MADNPEKRVERELSKSEGADHGRDALVPAGDRHRQAEAAIRLRLAGANYSEIADMLEFPTPALARAAIERHLAESVTEDDREQARYMEGQRLLRVMRSLYPRATLSEGTRDEEGNPQEPLYDHLGYAKVYLSYVDRRIKLYGLDAPTELTVAYSPRAEELQRAVQETLEELRGKFPEEADIMDADIIEESE